MRPARDYTKSKILVTGANGFIGKNLFNLLKSRYEIHGIDRFVLSDPMALQVAIAAVQPDYIIHLAAYGNHSDQQDDFEMITANIIKLNLLLQVSMDIPYKAFINVSSSSVYGKKNDPMKETDTLDTDTWYGATKVAGEYICRAFAKKYKKPVITVRPFSVYGEGERVDRLIPKTIDCAFSGDLMLLDPNAMHDWIHVNDFVSGLEAVMLHSDMLVGKAVNIGTGSMHPNHEVVEKVQWIIDKKVDLELTEPQREYDTAKSWVADNTLLKSLGWTPEFELMKGLRKTCNGLAREHEKD